jgi:hypothetical protein
MHPEAARPTWQLVVALVVVGCSDSGDPVASRLGAPSKLVAAPLGGGVHLTWSDNSDDEELFEIERKEGEPGNAFQPLETVPFGTALYHDANVTLGSLYTYRVRAKLPARFSAYSNQAIVNLTADGGGGSGGSGGQPSTAGSAGNGGSSGSSTVAGSATAGSGGGPTNSGGGPTNSGGGPTNNDVSFRTDVVPLLVNSCGSTTTGCHNSDQAVGRIMPQFGPCKVIWYSAVDVPVGSTYISGPNQGQPTGCPDLDLYERLMELYSMLCEAPSWEQRARYVVPGDLDKSLIYQVIAGDASMGGVCTSEGMPVRKMPLVDPEILPNGVELKDDGVAKIRDWILQGAKNN